MLRSIFFAPTTESKINDIIHSLKNKTYAGYDNISIISLKHISKPISKYMSDLRNSIFLTGTFPGQLKIVKVKPLYKSGKTSEPINYRPILISSSFSKIFEKAAAIRLKTYLLTSNILIDAQHSFRPGFNTTTALFDACNYVYGALDNRKLVLGIFLGISKAFDSVDHKLLLYKLDSLGIRHYYY